MRPSDSLIDGGQTNVIGLAMALVLSVTMLVPTTGCAPTSTPPDTEEPAAAPGPRPSATAMLDRSVLDDPTRPESERAEDGDRKAIEVYEWLGIQPGLTVGDLWPGEGYNTHLLSGVVGDNGRVVSVLDFYAAGDFATKESLQTRIEVAGLGNVQLLDDLQDMESSSIDVMLAVRNYHDAGLFTEYSRADAVAEMQRALKPGGVVGIVEVATDQPGWDEESHRLNEQVVIDDFTGAGFELSDRSDMLANPQDDQSTSGFEEGRHTMDRYLLKFTKTAGS